MVLCASCYNRIEEGQIVEIEAEPPHDTHSFEPIITSKGVIWADLPKREYDTIFFITIKKGQAVRMINTKVWEVLPQHGYKVGDRLKLVNYRGHRYRWQKVD